jgi:1,4-alpha-glucan branching enzyme
MMIKSINSSIDRKLKDLLSRDPYLSPYAQIIRRRLEKIEQTVERITQKQISLADFASGHEYFGLHWHNDGWIFREWAPNAKQVYLIGDMTEWQENNTFALTRINQEGVWEIILGPDQIKHGQHYRLRIHWPSGSGDRIPAYARRVVQDPDTLIFCAQVWRPKQPYQWQCVDFKCPGEPAFIYESHVGMATEDEKVGTYEEFQVNVLPRIIEAGYNTLQIMAIPEHPYYGSFGYHVSSFFAASSRFGTPEELKTLIDAAHGAGLAVIMDIVHSHAASNEVEGLSCFDGTPYQYFHAGARGRHYAWDSRCFDYGKDQVLHFLLSNCRFWLDEYHFDGFRFDGITSMLYLDHGLGEAFTSYDQYFSERVDEDALIYLALANRVIHAVRPDAMVIAEDISGMPGLASPQDKGGIGFNYRFAMGIPDHWIKLTKDTSDEYWHVGHLWHELTNRRPDEKTISYAESHDQALVGDKTLIFRLMDADMYQDMHKNHQNLIIDRGIALHKMIRLITLAAAGSGYLNFMGNEFGHPEWVDFPREGNNWSYYYARRQWSLLDHKELRYHLLADFDREMVTLTRRIHLLYTPELYQLWEHNDDKVLAFTRAGHIFIFNFHPQHSFVDYRIPVAKGTYQIVLDSDAARFGGHARLNPDQRYVTRKGTFEIGGIREYISLYLPNRSAQVLAPVVRI